MSYDLYTSLLKMHDAFCSTSDSVRMTIDMTARGLQVLREQYDLDKIAGTGRDFDRAVRVMDWLTTHVRHNGMCNPEGPRGAKTALEYAFDQPERGVNCAWLAATLTECLLSLGLPARTVYIMPFAPYDCDNHVVTEVWAVSSAYPHGQWVMLDPTCNCFVQDTSGTLLSVFDLRTALADQQEVVFNKELRYNGQPHEPAAHREYLAKDLYWFRMAEQSRLGEPARYVNVLPEGFDLPRQEVLNVQYRLRVQGDQPWLRSWLEQLEKRRGSSLTVSPADAWAAPEIFR